MSTNTNNNNDIIDFNDNDIEFDAHNAFDIDSEFDIKNVEFDNNASKRAFINVERRELIVIIIEMLRDQLQS